MEKEIKNLRDKAAEVLEGSTQRVETCIVPYKLIRRLEKAIRELDKARRREDEKNN